MDKIVIRGGEKLSGIIPVSGAKNAALPLMIASLLTDETLTLQNVPRLADVATLQTILSNHGVDYRVLGKKSSEQIQSGQQIEFQAQKIVDTTAPYETVKKMRAGFWVIGPLLARCGEARVSLPGGCAIGTRPVDLFIDGLKAMGADIQIDGGYVNARTTKGLTGAEINFLGSSVGATHVLMMAACLAKGQTVINNAAIEPEVGDLAECLVKMGAKIGGINTKTLAIDGVQSLHGATHTVPPDRIETGTFALCAAITGGDVTLDGTDSSLLGEVVPTFREVGVNIEDAEKNQIRVRCDTDDIKATDVRTEPFPGFPTDLQAQFMALMTLAKGTSRITETIFENRFMHVQELARLGASISIDNQTATVTGVDELSGAPVMATDLRASVSLVIAALAAKGQTEINRVYHLDRGFETLEKKLSGVGADIQRVL